MSFIDLHNLGPLSGGNHSPAGEWRGLFPLQQATRKSNLSGMIFV
jgi:hypothetical protein